MKRTEATTDVDRRGWRTLAISSLAVLAIFLDTTVLFVAFPDIVRSFADVSPASLSWVLNAYTITFAAFLIPAGKIADRVGHKRAFLTGSAVFTLASLLCAVAPSVGALVAFRILQALGAATLLPSSLALVLRAFPRERIPVAVGVWGSTGALAAAIGPTLGAALVEASGWRLVFLINLPVGLLTVGSGLYLLEESKDATSRIPALAGVILIAAAAALISLGIVQADEWGWTDARTLGSLLAGAALLAIFIVHQRSTGAPALDFDLFESANYRWANLATTVFSLAFTAMFFGSVLFLTDVWRWSILDAGLGISPGPLLVAVLAPVFGRLAARIGQQPLLLAGGVLFAAGGLWRLLMLGGESHYATDYLPSMLFTGIGVALTLPQLSSVVGQSLPANRLGVGGAVNQAVRQFGGTLGVALVIALLGQPSSLAQALDRFELVWWLMIAGGLLSSLLALPLRTTPIAVTSPRVALDLEQAAS
ncbi:MAG TPA: MFS transporter [Dehalococcoidia bacterium]|jgi:EmrB/QacA subfamily drug resistance transporter